MNSAMSLMLLLGMTVADDFDRLEGAPLSAIAKSADAQPREFLTVADLGTLPNVLAGTRTAVVIVKTDEANPARLLITPALRNPPGNKGEPVPILVVERFDTFEAGPATRKLAKGRDMILFDGFRLDLDSGQIVPEGQGGDLQFLATGDAGPRLVPIGPARMFTLKKSPLPPASASIGPSSGRNVLPGDFAGKYRLFANGQTSGILDLSVNEDAEILGRMRSDQTGGSYKVTGKIAPDATNHVRFSIELPRARQEFDGYLFLEGKGAIAGVYTLLDRPYGFFAIREGGSVAPEGEEVARSRWMRPRRNWSWRSVRAMR